MERKIRIIKGSSKHVEETLNKLAKSEPTMIISHLSSTEESITVLVEIF